MEEFGARLAAVEESAKSAHKRIDELKSKVERVGTMEGDIRVLTEKFKNMDARVDDINGKIDILLEAAQAPAKAALTAWQKVGLTALGAVVTALIGAVMALILKGGF